jgi:hypothetical protein
MLDFNDKKRKASLPFFLCSNFDLSNGCTLCSREPRGCFAPLFQNRKPSGLSEKTAFSFCKAFSFGATYSKEKAIKEFWYL